MGLNWNLTLKDGMSGPAAKASAAGNKVKETLIGIGAASDKADEGLRKTKATLIGLGDAARKTAPTLHSVAKGQEAIGKAADKGKRPVANWGKAMQIAAKQMWDERMARKQPMAIDKMSRSLDTGVPKVSAFGKAVQFMGRHFGPRGAQAVMGMGQLMEKYGGTVQKVGGALMSVGSAAASAAMAVGAITAGVGAIGTAMFAQLGMHVRGLQAFRESTMFAFTKILGTREEAQKVFDMAAKSSFDLGGDLRTNVSAMNALVAKGFKADFADELLRRLADLSTLNPSANLDALVYNIGKIRAQGRLQGDELQALSEAGLNVADVYQEIAKAMKLTQKPGQSLEEQVLQLQSAGKIKSDIAIPAIMSAIAKATGGGAAGAVATEKASKSPEGALMKLLNLKDQLLSSVKIDWSPIVRGAERMMAALSSPAGAAMIEKIGSSIGMIVGKLDGVSQEDMEKAFEKIGEGIEAFANALGAVLDLTIQLGPVWSLMADAAIVSMEQMQSMVEGVGMALGLIESQLTLIGATWDRITGEASGLGTAIIDGIIAGITGGQSSVVDAITSVASGAIDAAKATLGIASPSKVFADIGHNVSAGFGKGVAANSNAAISATTAMSSAAAATGRNAARSITNTRTDASKNVTATINVSGAQDPQTTGRVVSNRILALQAA